MPEQKPQHRVRITRPFYLGACEVTQEQYKRLTGVDIRAHESPMHPAVAVTWDDAVKYCEALSALPEEKSAGRAYRLPTEAQWEYACRAGSTTRFYFGNNERAYNDYAWFFAIGVLTHPVGQKLPNAWDLFDMHENAWEWCQDWYDATYYEHSPVDDPPGPVREAKRVFRSGKAGDPSSFSPSAGRAGYDPNATRGYCGFRVALDLAEKTEPLNEGH
jgi:formylglycine-generating enzyme required for sulfatase activity